jgi:Xaa-Pro aminopeptidase
MASVLPDGVFYAENRRRYLSVLGDDAAIFFGAPPRVRNSDVEFTYRQTSDIIYLTGWTDPEVVVLLRPNSDNPFVMFVQPKDPAREVWTGRRAGPKGAEERFGADIAYPISELEERLPALLQGHERLHHSFAESPTNDRLLMDAISKARRMGRRNGMSYPEVFVDPSRELHRLRLIKSQQEIEVMRHAAEITGEAHRAAMRMTSEGVHEFELEAEINNIFRKRGGSGPGYPCIVGGGENAVILHYVSNSDVLMDGDLVCVDAGCEYGWYTADVTRTWPVSGRFSPAQKRLYEAVLQAQLEAIEAAQSGSPYSGIHDAACRSLTRSLIGLGFLEGDLDELVEEKKFINWYMHGTSHWLGMDVHDVGPYAEKGESILLQPGMVLTIEPGLYVAPDDEEVPEAFRGIGIRIEDDILITADGPVVLSSSAPKTVEDIETLMAASG